MNTARVTGRALFVSLFVVVCAPTQVRAQHDPNVTSFTAGMLTFIAQSEVQAPVPNACVQSPYTVVNNPSVADDRKHFVKVTGPANEGNINIDYYIRLKVDAQTPGELTVGEFVATNVTVGLDGTGKWVERSVISDSVSLELGEHTADAFSYIKFRPSGANTANGHGHAFAIQ